MAMIIILKKIIIQMEFTLTTDTANALQEAMDKLDNTNLVNNIKNGFVEGWLEAQELMELKTKNNWNTNEAKQYYNSGLNK